MRPGRNAGCGDVRQLIQGIGLSPIRDGREEVDRESGAADGDEVRCGEGWKSRPSVRACELVRVSAGREETAGGVAQHVLRDQSVALAAGGVASLVFNGVELDERSTLDQCGIRSASGRERLGNRQSR
ncbi:unnamed protein product [Closterium sp. Naga37s-1]|nr:unnamed protein product [Closterium sp. Naga37s-1]